ncbi:MAG: LacI family transcriptional regulator [Alicyclobacillus herbarius]|uniref:LacI family DNA-binding transcriptional regulator n=1 Tax=Alicyclobacillus herbarius TaxID=122960 RepID=UPI002354D3C2|nr:LacI family DNA-binding transcriptional regulator [Alicyclobacillus herbarius]MCL6631170.1 LacI family transcriptional regulator [Alicyclobacillus herbarius]
MATRRDVARLAGVSPSTVSRVLNDNGYVAEDVRKRVHAAIKELNYVPNRLARSLRMQQSRQVACITPSISNSFYLEIVAGIEETALAHDYTFSLYSLTYEKREYLEVVLSGFYDGMILLAPYEMEKIIPLKELAERLPVSLYCDRERHLELPHVYVDLRSAMRECVNHLISLGHRRIVFMGYQFSRPAQNPRYLGYRDALKAHGIELDESLTRFFPDYQDTLTCGYQTVCDLLESGLNFTAICATNDLIAVGAMRALVEHGRKVPDDVSLTGVDDLEIASLVTPTLSTIQIPKRQIGNLLMEQMLSQIHGDGGVPRTTEVGTTLVLRESVGAPKVHHQGRTIG